jgi:type I restriction enzyme S subunit
MSMTPYLEYKDSGVEWIEKVPIHWNKLQVKHVFNLGRGRVISTEEVQPEGLYPVYSSQTMNDGCLGYIDSFDFDCDQITWTTDGANAGTIFLRSGKHNCTNVCGTLQPKNNDLSLKYAMYYLSHVTQFYKRPDTNGAKIMNGEMAAILFLLPTDTEQKKIASFLEHEVTKIDTLIAEQEKFIELLKEKRQAAVSHAVTKGIELNVKMKESGVEWFSQIPEHWQVTKLKYATSNIKAGPFGSAITKDMYTTSGYRVYGQEQVIPSDFSVGDYYIDENKFQELKQYEVRPLDLLISCVGTFGKIAVVPENIEAGIINPRLIRLRVNDKVEPHFLLENLRSKVVFEQLSSATRGGTMDTITIGTLSQVLIAIPPLVEQIAIIQEIEANNKKFDVLISESKRAIEILQERRSALITAAVTGQIDVRNIATQMEAA